MLIGKIGKMLSSPLVCNFTKLFAGTVAAKGLGFLSMPIIARIVKPEDFGAFSIFVAVASVVAPLLALRYVDAIPIPKSAARATLLLTLSLVLIGFNATLLLGIAIFLLEDISRIYPFINLRYLGLLYLAVIALSVYEAFSLWAVRVRNYGIIARTQAHQAFAGALSKVVLSYLAFPAGLMFGQVLQNITGIGSLIKYHRAPYQVHRIKFTSYLFKEVATHYAEYPKYRLASQMFLVMTQALPVLAAGKIYGQSEAGQLGMAVMVVSTPVMLIVGNARKLFYGEAVNIGAQNFRGLLDLMSNMMMKIAIMALIISCVLVLCGEIFFVYIFGSEWSLAGAVVGVYGYYIFFLFLSGPFVDLLNVLGMQKAYLAINFIRFVLAVLAFVILSGDQLMFSVIIFSGLMAVFYLLMGVFFFVALHMRCR